MQIEKINLRDTVKSSLEMRDNVGYQEITTLSEDGMNTSVADVFDQIEYSGEVPRRDKVNLSCVYTRIFPYL